MDPRVQELLDRPQYEQRTPEWYRAREDKITASNVASLLNKTETICGEYAKLFGLDDYIYDGKCCNPYSSKKQFMMNKVKSSYKGNAITSHGVQFEPPACHLYELLHGEDVIEFGLLPHSSIEFLAASPDGITASGRMIEIKCPPRRKITGVPPYYYWCQMQIQLEVCNLEFCDFAEFDFREIHSIGEFTCDDLDIKPVLHRGVLLRIESWPDDFDKRKYYYPKRECINDPDACIDWLNKKIEELVINEDLEIIESKGNALVCFDKIIKKKLCIRSIYWKCFQVSIVEVERSRKWYATVHDTLEQGWKEMMDFKQNYLETREIIIDFDDKEECLF